MGRKTRIHPIRDNFSVNDKMDEELSPLVTTRGCDIEKLHAEVTYKRNRWLELLLIGITLIASASAFFVINHGAIGLNRPGGSANLGFTIPSNLNSTTITSFVTQTESFNKTVTTTTTPPVSSFSSQNNSSATEVVETTFVTSTKVVTSNSTIFVIGFGNTTTVTITNITTVTSVPKHRGPSS